MFYDLTFQKIITTVIKKEIMYIIQNKLIKERGWTINMINNYLVYPDRRERNHINPRFASHKYYLLRRVRRVEGTEEFRIDMMNRRNRRTNRNRTNL